MCWEKYPPVTPLGGVPALGSEGFVTDEVRVELALGREGGFCADLGNVFEDLAPEVFLMTGGGPDEDGPGVLPGSEGEDEEGCLAALEDGTLGLEPDLED